MQKEITTIKLSKSTADSLNLLKIHPRQSYEEVILKFVQEHSRSRKSQLAQKISESNSKNQKEVTTIKLAKKNVEILNQLKIHPRQPYEEVILNLISENEDSKKKTQR